MTRWTGIAIALGGVVVLIVLGTEGARIRAESLAGAAVATPADPGHPALDSTLEEGRERGDDGGVGG